MLLLLLGVAAGSGAAQPQPGDYTLTVYAAYRDGGSFTDVASDSKLPIEASGAWAISLDLKPDHRAGTQLQIYVSRQSSDVDARNATPPNPAGTPLPAKFPMAVTYAHIGGIAFLDRKIGQGVYLAGGIGATLFEPDLNGLANELRPSVSVALGYQLPLGERAALRFEARGYATLVNSDSALFCSGGCVISIRGETVTQGEVQLGLSFRF
ncbi:MAG: hypothetical protein ACRET6_04720 [Burkholderiales bacterium]